MRTTALTLTAENALVLRYGLLVLMILPGLLITGGWRIAREHWPRLLITGAGMFGSAWFTIQGFARIAAGLGTVISMVEPIIIALLFWAFLREPISSRIWQGLLVSVTGAAVLFWPDITASTTNPVGFIRWNIAEGNEPELWTDEIESLAAQFNPTVELEELFAKKEAHH